MENQDKKVLNIVLFEPEIPQNTGNVARTCAATGARLHLVRPFGFEITDRNLKRAGLDYWYLVDITYYDSIDDFFEKTAGGEYFFFSTKARRKHSDVAYPDGAYIIFGKETRGKTRLQITDAAGTISEVLIPKGKTLLVNEGQVVDKGDLIVDGPAGKVKDAMVPPLREVGLLNLLQDARKAMRAL